MNRTSRSDTVLANTHLHPPFMSKLHDHGGSFETNQPAEHFSPSVLDLELLENDLAPTFVIKISSAPIQFELLFCNEAFRSHENRYQKSILADNRNALLFRSWSQSVGDSNPTCKFQNQQWTGIVAGQGGCWKIIKAIADSANQEGISCGNAEEQCGRQRRRSNNVKQTKDQFLQAIGRDNSSVLQDISEAQIDPRWASLQVMMELSDVGVFEFDLSGRLLHANEAWYKLSSYPRHRRDQAEFEFMDLVHTDDREIAMSKWNSLAMGFPQTFEIRWKTQPKSNDTALWVIATCVPVFDDEGALICIAGNVIDTNAQKKSQEAAQARLEALEQARRSEMKFARLAQLSPTAIYIFTPETGMEFVNAQFFELTGKSNAPINQSEWFELIAEEDIAKVKEEWIGLLAGKRCDGIQFRLKNTWLNQDGLRSNIWVQCSSYPELDDNGKVISVMGTLFDISQFKWAESLQHRRIEEALEAKRQQENFIDMTSHELRNPLSAMLQCADSAINSLQKSSVEGGGNWWIKSGTSQAQAEIAACIEALQTIIACSLHQKRVIDDVLTLSKLDSRLLLITPVCVQASAVVTDALKMFDVECAQMKIDLLLHEDVSLQGMEWAMLDPSRLLQILVNLITNAVKFTKDSPRRRITVTLGGCWTRPPKCWQGIALSTHGPEEGMFDKQEWGQGRKIYIWLKVADTGVGMSENEQKTLFGKFSQATPRTHVKYGGSGLGLFICKSLSALQGGAIGVRSTKGEGTTIGFYVGARLCSAPETQISRYRRPVLHRTISTEDAMRKVELNILIVEDNLVNQKVLQKQLQKFGWNIFVAGNGLEALEWLRDSVYWREECNYTQLFILKDNAVDRVKFHRSKVEIDIILMDIEMPIMDGLDCTRRIRDLEAQGTLANPPPSPLPRCRLCPRTISPITPSTESNPYEKAWRPKLRIPILAVSANVRSEQVGRAMVAGMDDAISKPFRVSELWPKIRGLVERIGDQAGSESGGSALVDYAG